CAWPCEPEAVAGPQCEPQARRACERGRASRSRRRGEPVKTEPVAIIAAGAVTPIGADLDAFWTGLVTGTDGVSRIERFPVGDLRVGLGGEIKKLKRERRGDCRASQLLFAAADDLRARASLGAPPARVAVVLGTALGGVEEGEKALAGDPSARRAAAALYDGPARALALRLGARGPVMTVSTACASGATALGVAADLLRSDAADLVVAGGYDILCRFVMRGFDALRSLTRDRVRPFDRRRSGLRRGEGAALVLLARDRDAGQRGVAAVAGAAGRDDEGPVDVGGRGRRAGGAGVSDSPRLGVGGCDAAVGLEGGARRPAGRWRQRALLAGGGRARPRCRRTPS